MYYALKKKTIYIIIRLLLKFFYPNSLFCQKAESWRAISKEDNKKYLVKPQTVLFDWIEKKKYKKTAVAYHPFTFLNNVRNKC